MGWCGPHKDTHSWQHGSIDPCSSETVSATVLGLFASGVVWAAWRRVRLLPGHQPGRQTGQLASLLSSLLVSALHAALLGLVCVISPVPFQILFEAITGLIWAAAAVRYPGVYYQPCVRWQQCFHNSL